RFKLVAHAADGPKQVDGGGASLADSVADLVEIAPQFRNVVTFRIARAKRNSHGGRDADRRRTAHYHTADGVRYFFVRRAGDVALLDGKLGLINEAHAFIRP